MDLALLRHCRRPASARAPAALCCRYSLSTSAWSSVKSWSLPWRCRSFGNSGRTPCLSRGGRRHVQRPLRSSAVFGSWSECTRIDGEYIDSSRLLLTLAFVVVAASLCHSALATTLQFSTGEI